jgi:hypothetical protein
LNQQKPKVQEEKEVKQLSSLPALLSIIMEWLLSTVWNLTDGHVSLAISSL